MLEHEIIFYQLERKISHKAALEKQKEEGECAKYTG